MLINDDGIADVIHHNILNSDIGSKGRVGGDGPCFNPKTVVSMANCAVAYIYFGYGVFIWEFAHAPNAKPMPRATNTPADIHILASRKDGYAIISGVKCRIQNLNSLRYCYVYSICIRAVVGGRCPNITKRQVLALEYADVLIFSIDRSYMMNPCMIDELQSQ